MFAETCMTVLKSVRILILLQLVVERIYRHCCESMRMCVCVCVCLLVCVCVCVCVCVFVYGTL